MTPERIEELRQLIAGEDKGELLLSEFRELLDAAAQLARLRERLERLRPLEAAATPGPWVWRDDGLDFGYVGPAGQTTVLYGESSEGAVDEEDPDGRFLAAARNEIAAMLRVVGP